LRYDRMFGNLGTIAILFVFLVVVGNAFTAKNIEKHLANHAQWWNRGFWGAFLSIVAMVLFVNPHGAFPWNPVPSSAISAFVPTAARSEKVTLYDQLDSTPEVVVFGSSRAFTLPSVYIEEKTGYRTFNMAVNGGGPLDFLTFGRFVMSRKEAPVVIIVELVVPSMKVSESPMPVSMISYLDRERGFKTAEKVLLDVLSLQSVSDMVYQTTYAVIFPREPAMVFMPDGTGVRAPSSEAEYKVALERITDHLNRTYKCKSLYEEGVRQIEQLVELAAEHQTAILFYRSPLNADFLDAADSKHPDYIKCESLFNDYMANMITTHTNVFFHDLTYYEPIGSLRWTGYFDAHHLKPVAAHLLIDALAGDIQAAGEWADRERSLNQSR
jgi:hypothetical protein